ncbi:MAG: hypothetical protein U0V73_02370 [Acidimicrobiia bacterium]
MTSPDPILDALVDDAIDEAVSALLDGELDEWAEEHGTNPATAKDWLEHRSDFARRRDVLRAARTALTGGAPLDELGRARLVRTALQATAPAPGRRRWAIMAGAAAAVVVAAGVGFALTRNGDEAARTASAGPTTAAPSRAVFRGDFGDVSDPDVLRAAVAAGKSTGAAGSALKGMSSAATSTSAPRTSSPSADNAGEANVSTHDTVPPEPVSAAVVDRCARSRESSGARVTQTATGRYHDVPVVIAVVTTDTRSTTWVLDASTCAPLASQLTKLP